MRNRRMREVDATVAKVVVIVVGIAFLLAVSLYRALRFTHNMEHSPGGDSSRPGT
jgi:hypothetical protein